MYHTYVTHHEMYTMSPRTTDTCGGKSHHNHDVIHSPHAWYTHVNTACRMITWKLEGMRNRRWKRNRCAVKFSMQ